MKEAAKSTRRRGDTLSECIYDATIELLKKEGYTNLSFQQIARAAKTSRTVMYRRWDNTFELIREIMVCRMREALDGELIDKIEDTGSLRGDLLLLLTLYQSIYNAVGPEIINAILFEMSHNSEKMAEITMNATSRNILTMRKLLSFAKNRGEQIKELSDATLTLPFDLIRVEYFLRKEVVDTKRLEVLVDEILLPVFLA